MSPHVGADATASARNQKGCNKCHVIHDSAASAKNLLSTNQSATEPNASIALCESCHMSNTASEKTFVQASLTQTSGHTIKNAQNANGILECSTCHGVHQDSDAAKGALLPSTIKKFGTLSSDISVNTSAKNAQCVACHDESKTWYTATHTGAYPSTSSPEKLTGQSSSTGLNGYPISGTFPGVAVANSTTKNVHALISASGTYDEGDCRYCHSSHANGNRSQLNTDRGELRAMKATGGVVSDEEKTSGAFASFCLSCHNGSNKGTPWAAAQDVASSFMVLPGSTDASRTAFLNSNAGHRISSSTGDLPAGSALPCYACHNPHGSATNEKNFNDELGINLKDNRDFCFTCHVTSDGYVCEDGNAGTVVPIASAMRQSVYGISRTSGKLKLVDINGHQKGSTAQCSDCHGSTHSPATTQIACSTYGKKCTDCHASATTGEYPSAASYVSTAVDSTDANDWVNSHTAHLIPAWKMRAYNDSSRTGVYCEGCHAWGRITLGGSDNGSQVPGLAFQSTLGAGYPLRTAYKSLQADDADWKTSSPNGGLCLSCHERAASSSTSSTDGLKSITNAQYNADYYHNYTVSTKNVSQSNGVSNSNYNVSFQANCTKCHNNATPIANPAVSLGTSNQVNMRFDVHYKQNTRLLAKIGIQADIARPATHNDVLTTICVTCHGAGQTYEAHGGKRTGQCFSGCHSVEEILNRAEHKQANWYSTVKCANCHSINQPTTHLVAPDSCSTATSGCHVGMSAHVTKMKGRCFAGCHSQTAIVRAKNASGSLVHTSSVWNSFADCSKCHTTISQSSWEKPFNNRGTCFGCHSQKGQISGNSGKSYTHYDWYGVRKMNDMSPGNSTLANPWDTPSSPLTYGLGASKTYATKTFKNSVGTITGTVTHDGESVLDDMFVIPTSGFGSGDGTNGSTDKAVTQSFDNALETSGHQINRRKDTWSANAQLKSYTKTHMAAIRCSECHNVHDVKTSVLGTHNEWPLTTKSLPGKTGGVQSIVLSGANTTVYTDNTMPTSAIASDGTRLITLNDFWSRNSLVGPVKTLIVNWLQTSAGGSYSAADAETRYGKMDYEGITSAQITAAGGSSDLATQWSRTVDITCFHCHDEASMNTAAHASGRKSTTHMNASLACVNCHSPNIHGSKMPSLLSDRGAYDTDNDGVPDVNDPDSLVYSATAATHSAMSKNSEFYWTTYKHNGGSPSTINTTPTVVRTNAPTAELYSYNPSHAGLATWDYSGCSTSSNCHSSTSFYQSTLYQSEQTGSNWKNWTGSN